MDEQSPPPEAQGVAVGVDIGGTKTALLATDIATGDDLACDRYPTPADAGPTAALEALVEAVRRLVEQTGRPSEALRAVGVAVPGYVDADAGRVIRAGNLAGWLDLPLRALLERALDMPAYVDNDASMAALGEKWRGAAKQMNNFVFLAFGTGVGAGIVVNGRLHRGYHHAAGEVGNFLMSRRALGKERHGHGDLELRVGGPAIEDLTEEAGESLKLKGLFRGAAADRKLRRLAERTADYVAMAVVNITALLDPEAIVFGGGGAATNEDLLEAVRRRVERELHICPALMLSALGEEAQLHGAVFGALWQLNPSLALREELR